jgi:surface protein
VIGIQTDAGYQNRDRGFQDAVAFDGDVSMWDVSNVAIMSATFGGTAFNSDISTWDVSSVNEMRSLFRHSPFNGDISLWDVSSVVTMTDLFTDSPFNGELSLWDVSAVRNMGGVFAFSIAFNGDISNWDVSSVETMFRAFYFAEAFARDLSAWDVDNVHDFSQLFTGAPALANELRGSAWASNVAAWNAAVGGFLTLAGASTYADRECQDTPRYLDTGGNPCYAGGCYGFMCTSNDGVNFRANCPATCGLCGNRERGSQPSLACIDVPDYTRNSIPCVAWVNADCWDPLFDSEYFMWVGVFRPNELADVRANCPASCGLCGDGGNSEDTASESSPSASSSFFSTGNVVMLSVGSLFGMGLLCYGIQKHFGLRKELMHTFFPKNDSRITIEAVVLQVPDPPVENEPISFDDISSSIAEETGSQQTESDDEIPQIAAAMDNFPPKNDSRISIEAIVLQVPDPPVKNTPVSFDGVLSSVADKTGPQQTDIDDGFPQTMAATEAFRLASQLVVSAVEADTNHEIDKARGLYVEALPLFDIVLLSDDSEFSPAQRSALLSRVESYRLRAVTLLQKKSDRTIPPEV